MKPQSTRQAAKLLGISLMTLQRYIADGNWIKAPGLQKVGGVRVRLWSDRDIARAKKLMKAS
jgi:predicted site-specific integrase-resolvase